jgi:NDP-sugar pyrophosphorylase family protein
MGRKSVSLLSSLGIVYFSGTTRHKMLFIENYIEGVASVFPVPREISPWDFIQHLPELLHELLAGINEDYAVINEVAIHRSAMVDSSAIIRGPAIIGENALIGCYALVRSGVYIGKNSIVGAHCEVKQSVLMNHSCCGHFNFVGESLIGNGVNLEAGAVLANHFNELKDQPVTVRVNGQTIDTGCLKFGSVIGDGSRIGANAVVLPGTLLQKNTVVERLALVKG